MSILYRLPSELAAAGAEGAGVLDLAGEADAAGTAGAAARGVPVGASLAGRASFATCAAAMAAATARPPAWRWRRPPGTLLECCVP